MAEANLLAQIEARLAAHPPAAQDAEWLQFDWRPPGGFAVPPTPAAVLVGLVERGGRMNVLLTRRADDLRTHSGQIAFPGGKIDAADDGPAAAALREAHEEVDLEPDDARVLGYLPAFRTGNNYLIYPVVAVVAPRRPFAPNPDEVAEVFEVPLDIMLSGQSYGRHAVSGREREHSTWRIDYDGRVIWGITANLARYFCDLVASETVAP